MRLYRHGIYKSEVGLLTKKKSNHKKLINHIKPSAKNLRVIFVQDLYFILQVKKVYSQGESFISATDLDKHIFGFISFCVLHSKNQSTTYRLVQKAAALTQSKKMCSHLLLLPNFYPSVSQDQPENLWSFTIDHCRV